jgi:hypothetical protein
MKNRIKAKKPNLEINSKVLIGRNFIKVKNRLHLKKLSKRGEYLLRILPATIIKNETSPIVKIDKDSNELKRGETYTVDIRLSKSVSEMTHGMFLGDLSETHLFKEMKKVEY